MNKDDIYSSIYLLNSLTKYLLFENHIVKNIANVGTKADRSGFIITF
jgi:hypothetical protein